MKYLFYIAFCAALPFLGDALKAINNSDPILRGGAAHECYRDCVADDTRTCYFEFTLTEWLTMSSQCGDCPYNETACYNGGCLTAGGEVRTTVVVNYMLPGPSIEVCKGDTVLVKLTNGHGAEAASIHWHGMGQIDTPYMDGVPYVTQCPILPGNSFLYNFTADPAGTHIWHSHVGVQETDGFHGSLIVREANDVNADYYDYDLPEHTMVIWHWFANPTSSEIKSFMLRSKAPTGHSLTVNGYAATLEFTKNDTSYYTPRANFTVTQGYRYRFRTIANMAIYCPFQVSIDDHKILVIAADGATVEPTEVDSFIVNAGERYDFVLTADQPEENYWIRYRGLGSCEAVSAVAILHYEGASDETPSGSTEYDDANRSGVLLGPVAEEFTDYSDNTLIRISELENTMCDAQDVSGTPDFIFYVPIAMTSYKNHHTPGPWGQMNNISCTLPPVPLLTQHSEITSDMYCTPDDDTAKKCSNGFCTCPYIYEATLGSLIEVILIDETISWHDDHPIHFHGHYMRVVSMVPGNSTIKKAEVQAMNEAGLIEKNFDTAPLRDTIGVPAHGFVVLRMVADNPGYWIFHCHVAAHSEEGMTAVFKIGDHSEMVQAPANFPKCSGNFNGTTQS